MMGRYVPLVDEVVKLLHGAVLMNLPTGGTHMQAFFRGMFFATTLLTGQSFPTSAIIMPLRAAVRAGFRKPDAIAVIVPVCIPQSVSLLSRICDLIGSGRHTDLAEKLFFIRSVRA